MQTHLRAAQRLALAVLLGFAAATCTDQPTEPGGGHVAQVRFTPVFKSNTFVAGLPLDNIRVIVVRAPAETLVDTNAPFAVTDSVLQLNVSVDLKAPSESLEVTLDLLSGTSLLFRGRDTLLVTAGTGTSAPPIVMSYVGPGADIYYLDISPRDTVLSFGDTLVFGATAANSSEQTETAYYLRWYTTPPGVPIRSDGRLIAPNSRGSVMVHAWTPSGKEDSTSVTFVPVPTQLLKISGDLQNDTVSDTLTAPFVVEVRATDNLPVRNVPVTFAAVTAGGSVLYTAGVTDSLGRASTIGILGDTARTYSYTATVAGVAPVTFQATANAGPAATIAKVSGDAQSDTAGKTLPQPLVVRVADAGNNPVAGATVVWTRVTGSGTPALDTVLTDGAGHAQLVYTLGASGTDSIRATLAGTAAFVDFTATAAIGAVKVVVISGDLQTDTVTHLLSAPLVIETQVVGGTTPVPGVQVTWVINVGSGVLSADTTVTDSLGRSAVTLTFGTVSGPVEVLVDAKLGGSLGVFHFTALAKAPNHLAFVVLEADTQKAGVLFTPQPVVQVRDTFNNTVHTAGIAINAVTTWSLGTPPPPKFTAGGIQFSSSVGGLDSAVTDTSGNAAFTGLFLLGAKGPEILRFRVNALPLIPHLLDSLVLIPGLPKSVIPTAGNGQTAFVDSLVTTAPQAHVVDISGNGVPGVSVDFVVTGGGGVATGDTVVTDSLGYATVGSWRMGSAPGTDSLEARVMGLTPAVFTATAQPLTPTILLQLLGTTVVGVGRSAPLEVRLSSPAPVGGVVVSFASDNPSVVSVDSASMTFNQNDTLRYMTLTGVAVGTAHILVTAPGYVSDTLQVTGSLNLISLPTTLNVPYGANSSIAVTLGQPAPAGGVVVTLISSDSTTVGIVTPTVTIPQGQSSVNGTVHGTALGTATVAATNPNYAPDASTVSTTATLNIVNGSQTIFSTIPITQTLEFRSAGALIAAPAGGIVANLSANDPTCVAVPATSTIPAGLSSTTFLPTYGGSAILPCNTTVVASYAGVNPDSIAMTVNPPPTSTLTASDVGSGLGTSAYGYLQTGVPTPRNMVIRSLDTTKVLVAVMDTMVGADSAVFPLAVNESFRYYYIRGKEGIVNDSAQVELSAPGYLTSTAWIRVRAPGVVLSGYPSTTTTLSPPTAVSALIGLPNLGNTSIAAYQPVRPSGTLAKVVTFTLTPSGVATLSDSTGVQDTVRTAPLVAGQYYTGNLAQGGVQYIPLTTGVTTLSVAAPGYVTLPATGTTTISAPTSTLTSSDVGSGLATSAYGYLQTGVPTARSMTITSLDTTKVLVATSDTAVGSESAVFPLAVNESFRYYYIRGKEGIINDSALIQLSAPGYGSSTAWIRVRAPGIMMSSYPSTITTLAPPTSVTAVIGLPTLGNTTIAAYQGLRPAGTLGTVVTFTVTPSGLATLSKADSVQDTVRTAPLVPGQYYTGNLAQGGVQYTALATGVTTLTAAAPGFVMLPGATQPTTISTPGITLASPGTVGAGLQSSGYFYLGASRHGGDSVWIKSSNPSVALVAPDNVTPGSDSAMIFIPDGQTFTYFYVQGVDGASGTPILTVRANGFIDATAGVTIVQPGVQIGSVPSSISSTAGDQMIYAYTGVPNPSNTGLNTYQERRPGGSPLTVTFTSGNPAAATLVNSGGPGSPLTADITAGVYNTPTTVPSGGVALRPVAVGVSAISVTLPGFIAQTTATATVNVTP